MLFLIAIVTSFVVTFVILPIIIRVSRSIDLLDSPDRRKIHRIRTPSLGGIGVFIGAALSIPLCMSFVDIVNLKYFLLAIVLIFLLGVRDDVSSLEAKQKIVVQLLSAVLVFFMSGIELTGFYGLFGFGEVPYWISAGLTIFMIVAMTNSYNLIDGIDGLAGSIGMLILSVYAAIFFQAGYTPLATICLSVAGGLFAFLFFNWHPSKIFMGDTGSMMLGFIIAVMSIVVINHGAGVVILPGFHVSSPLAVAFAALIVPIYDTSRVFTIRILNGNSPFFPDRNHTHHALLKLGLNHSKATVLLVSMNAAILAFVLIFNGIGTEWLILISYALMFCFGLSVDLLGRRKRFLGISSKVRKEQPKSLYVSKSA